MKTFILFLALAFFSISFGQSENVFIERSYWKKQPTLEQVQADIKAGNDPSAFNEHKFDAVTWAILEDASSEIIWLLLSQDGNGVDKRAHDGRTPLFWAAYKNNVELMKALIEKGASTDLLDSHGYSVVNFAANTGQINPELYDLCISEGANLKKEQTSDGATPLLLILPHLQSADMISYFTSKGLKLEETDNDGNNAFVYAAKSGNSFILNYLLDAGLSPHANNDAAVLFASKGMRGSSISVETFSYLKSKGLNMGATDSEGRNALHFLASRNKDPEVFEFFLKKGLSLNRKDANGQTPYFNAFENNTPEIIALLLPKEKVTEKMNAEGENVIHIAAKRGNAEVLKLALTAENEIDGMSEIGLAPLHIAAMKSTDFELIELLLNAGADKTLQTPFEETAFDLAMENTWLKDKTRVKTLLK